jgi:hypothetical protein
MTHFAARIGPESAKTSEKNELFPQKNARYWALFGRNSAHSDHNSA